MIMRAIFNIMLRLGLVCALLVGMISVWSAFIGGYQALPSINANNSRTLFIIDAERQSYGATTSQRFNSVDVPSTLYARIQQTLQSNESVCCYDWSPDGEQVIFRVSHRIATSEYYVDRGALFLADREGHNIRPLTRQLDEIHMARWSPHGHYIAYKLQHLRQDIYVIDVETINRFDLTEIPHNYYVTEASSWNWHPDGEAIIYAAPLRGTRNPVRYDFALYIIDMQSRKVSTMLDYIPSSYELSVLARFP